MAHLIHSDYNDKENPGIMNVKEKSNVPFGASKQPLALIGGKENTMAVLNSKNIKNNSQGNVPVGKVALRAIGNQNVGFAAAKKSNVVPVVDQFKAFSVYEDNCDTQVQLQQHTRLDVAEKENIQANVANINLLEKNDSTPMSIVDMQSPMSVDLSMADTSTQLTSDQDLDISVVDVPLPRNDRQRFFEVIEYQHDILENFRVSEKLHRPKPQYMRRQTDINHSMRAILVDWLVEVAEEYKLDTETLYLTVSYLDRFLSQMSVKRSKLQLVGTAAMYIAAKYEEIHPPDVSDFVFLTDDSYTKGQVLRMEQVFLKILTFNLCSPTAYVFINTYAVLCDMPEQLKSMTLFLSELSLLEGETYMKYLPSVMSAASLALARHLYNMPIWSKQMEEITSYKLEDLTEIMLMLCKTHKAARGLNTQAIREKYKRDKHNKVACIDSIELSQEDMDSIVETYNTSREELPLNANSNSKVNLFYKF